MPVELSSRCLRCKALKPHREFPIVALTRDPKTKKKRVTHDVYCMACRPYVTPAMRAADMRDQLPKGWK